MVHSAENRTAKTGLGPRNCKGCGDEFQPSRSRQIYCSERCCDNGPTATKTRLAYRARPEVQERIRGSRRLATSSDAERQRVYNLRGNLKRYGVTVEWFESKLAEQDGRCMICGATPDPNGIKASARLHVDHDHDTKAVRDLLCTRCNQGLGYFRESPDRLRAAADYLDRHRS